ncbi:MAG: phage tail tape measure protein, partial [Dermatophilaceae bacterium]|nr:phage tail tape measure protein [Dermatophilaceae bacterium]
MASLALLFDVLARDRASKTFDKVGDSAERAGRKVEGSGKRSSGGMGAMGVAARLAGGAIVAGFGVSIKKAMDFDKTMRTVGATLGAGGAVQKDLSALALKLGKETSFSASQASDAMLELAKGGMDAAQIKAGALSSTLTLAAAGGLELGDAAGYMVKSLNTFGLKATDSGKVAAALAGAANASTSSVEDMGLALAQVGPGAKIAGLSLQDTAAALAEFSDNGVRGQDAGTSLKQMLVGLVPTTDKNITMFENLGLMTFDSARAMQVLRDNGVKPLGSDTDTLRGQLQKLAAHLSGAKEGSAKANKEYMKLATSTGALSNQFFDAKGNIKSMAEVSGILQKALAGQTKEQKIATLNTLFGSDASRAAGILAEKGATGLAKYVKAVNDQSSAQRMAKTATDGAAGAWEQFLGSIETIAIAIGTRLLPLATKLLSWATDIANRMLENVGPAFDAVSRAVGATTKWFQEHKAVVTAAAIALAGLVAVTKLHAAVLTVQAAGGLIKYIAQTRLVTALTRTWAAVQWLMNAALNANPIGLIITGIAALAAGIIYAYKNSETFRKIVDTAFHAIADVGRWLWNKVLGPVIRFLIDGFSTVADWIGNMLEALSHVPGFGWAKDAADKLHGAAAKAKEFGQNIKDIPDPEIDTSKADAEMAAFYKKWSGKSVAINANVHGDVGNYRGGGSGGGGSVDRPVPGPIGTGWNGYPGHKGLDFP